MAITTHFPAGRFGSPINNYNEDTKAQSIKYVQSQWLSVSHLVDQTSICRSQHRASTAPSNPPLPFIHPDRNGSIPDEIQAQRVTLSPSLVLEGVDVTLVEEASSANDGFAVDKLAEAVEDGLGEVGHGPAGLVVDGLGLVVAEVDDLDVGEEVEAVVGVAANDEDDGAVD